MNQYATNAMTILPLRFVVIEICVESFSFVFYIPLCCSDRKLDANLQRKEEFVDRKRRIAAEGYDENKECMLQYSFLVDIQCITFLVHAWRHFVILPSYSVTVLFLEPAAGVDEGRERQRLHEWLVPSV